VLPEQLVCAVDEMDPHGPIIGHHPRHISAEASRPLAVSCSWVSGALGSATLKQGWTPVG
jgi:hypothetical protein